MKRLISLLAVALFGVALVGCSDNEETTPPTPPDPKPVDVYGWHMTKWEVGGDDTNFPKEVYIVSTRRRISKCIRTSARTGS